MIKVQFGDVIRQHWHGPTETLMKDVSRTKADEYLESSKAKRASDAGAAGVEGTFDHFMATRWGWE